MVGDRQGGHLEFLRARDQLVDAVGAVEQGVLGMRVQVNEGHGVPRVVGARGRRVGSSVRRVYIIPARAAAFETRENPSEARIS